MKNLRPIEHKYEDEILDRIIDETDLLKKCINIVDKTP